MGTETKMPEIHKERGNAFFKLCGNFILKKCKRFE